MCFLLQILGTKVLVRRSTLPALINKYIINKYTQTIQGTYVSVVNAEMCYILGPRVFMAA